jgi:hypothetical protein
MQVVNKINSVLPPLPPSPPPQLLQQIEEKSTSTVATLSTMLFTNDESSFTRVTSRCRDKTDFDGSRNSNNNENTSKWASSLARSSNATTSITSAIVFDNLIQSNSIANDEIIERGFAAPLNSLVQQAKATKTKRLADRTNTTNKIINKLNKMPISVAEAASMTSTTEFVKVDYTPKLLTKAIRRKYMRICCLGLSSEQVQAAERYVKKLNELMSRDDIPLADSNYSAHRVEASLEDSFGVESTHLILDFKRIFQNNSQQINLKYKLIMLNAALRRCKIVSYEWIEQSRVRKKWLGEKSFEMESYLGDSLVNYKYADTDEVNEKEAQERSKAFDVRMARLLRLCKNKISHDLFKKCKNVYIIPEAPQLQQPNQSCSSQSDFESSNFFADYDTCQCLLSELIVKCGGHITSRMECAELLIAVDKTNDYDEESNVDKTKIELEQNYFAEKILEYRRKLRKKSGVQVLTSDWIIGKKIHTVHVSHFCLV